MYLFNHRMENLRCLRKTIAAVTKAYMMGSIPENKLPGFCSLVDKLSSTMVLEQKYKDKEGKDDE
jgi:hypothetical protein